MTSSAAEIPNCSKSVDMVEIPWPINLLIYSLVVVSLQYSFINKCKSVKPNQSISWKIVFLPIVLFYNMMCALCLIFWISALAYRKRDLFHLIPYLLTFGIWFSPVFFSSDLLPEQYRYLLDLNPMTNVVQMWRWSLFDFGEMKWIWAVNFLIVFLLFLGGSYLYSKRESRFSDVI